MKYFIVSLDGGEGSGLRGGGGRAGLHVQINIHRRPPVPPTNPGYLWPRHPTAHTLNVDRGKLMFSGARG